MTNTPSPRTLEHAAMLVDMDLPANVLREAIFGAIGQEAGIEFLGFMKIADELPDIASILNNPDALSDCLDWMQQGKPEQLWALTVGLANHVDTDTAGNFVRVVNALPKEYGIVAVNELNSKKPELWNQKETLELALHIQDAFLTSPLP